MNVTQIKTPILFMVFNRPEKTLQVWEQIRKVKPLNLYVSADGARDTHPEDDLKCKQVREIVTKIDWVCNARFLLHEKNLGCSLAGKTAFDWIFAHEDRMIELEDDTIPSQSFFLFMENLLEKYKDNENIGFITGQNFMGIKSGVATYFFSHYFGSSGWGTWKRIYSKWDFQISNLKDVAYSREFRKNFDSNFEYKYWLKKFLYYKEKGGNTYDLQSVFLTFKEDLINIIPNNNLITNIGFDLEGTNFNGGNEKFANKARYELNEITHPKELKREVSIDKRFFDFHFLSRSRINYKCRWFLSPILKRFKVLIHYSQ